MKKSEKFGIIFWLFVLFMMSLALFGCSTASQEVVDVI